MFHGSLEIQRCEQRKALCFCNEEDRENARVWAARPPAPRPDIAEVWLYLTHRTSLIY